MKEFKPWNAKQAEYIRLIAENQITIAIGPAGTAKTAIPAYLACEKLLSHLITKVVISRPIVESGNGIGYLKGTMLEKCMPYMMPLFEEFVKWMGKNKVDELIADGTIEICPPEFMRGRTYNQAMIIVDEAQNLTIEQIRLVLSRLGRNSKMIINGDPDQTDLPECDAGALLFSYKQLISMQDIGCIQFNAGDIVRNPLIGPIIKKISNANFQDFQTTGSNSNYNKKQ